MTDAENPNLPLERVPTGISGLDTILHGGLLKGGMYIIMGHPGAGKTILGNQMCFHHVRSGGRAIYVTLLAESHSRMFGHLDSLEFFSREFLSRELSYVSGYNALEKDGPDGLLKLLRQIVQAGNIDLLVLDGLVSAQNMARSELHFKKFVHELNVFTNMLGCTTLLLTSTDPGQPLHPEHTMVDGILSLQQHTTGMRAYRSLEVMKFRGSGSLRGRHTFDITPRGLTVHPRLESIGKKRRSQPGLRRDKVPFGLTELDKMLGGGIPANSLSMILGGPGTGKTTLGLQFLVTGAMNDERCLFFGFYETPQKLLLKSQVVGLPMDDHIDSKLFIEWHPPLEADIDEMAHQLLDAVDRHDIKRVYLDGLGGFQQASVDPERMGRFFTALTNELRHRDCTTLFSVESKQMFGLDPYIPTSGVSAIAENIILLLATQPEDRILRQLSILKVRESTHDITIRDFEISSQGIKISSTPSKAKYASEERE